MKQTASHLEEDITAKRQNIVHINTIISNKAAANLLRSYLKEKDMETNCEMFDVAMPADARTKKWRSLQNHNINNTKEEI